MNLFKWILPDCDLKSHTLIFSNQMSREREVVIYWNIFTPPFSSPSSRSRVFPPPSTTSIAVLTAGLVQSLHLQTLHYHTRQTTHFGRFWKSLKLFNIQVLFFFVQYNNMNLMKVFLQLQLQLPMSQNYSCWLSCHSLYPVENFL